MTDEFVNDAIERMLQRVDATSEQVTAFPHWADVRTGAWTQTADGDWTGGAWVGELWLALRLTGDVKYRTLARRWCAALWPRLEVDSVYRAFTVYYGGALGEVLHEDGEARALALEGAHRLATMYDPRLGLIPLGEEAEEGSATGAAESAIDSLEASALLLWAADTSSDDHLRRIAVEHTSRVLGLHVHADGSIIQSTTLRADDGEVIRHHTHKGFSASSIWARAQAWGMLFTAISYSRLDGEPAWLDYAVRSAEWWMSHVPDDLVAPWDFDDPNALAQGPRDTAGTAIAASALLKLAAVVPDADAAQRYRSFVERTVRSLVTDHVTPVGPDDTRPPGMLTGGCFTVRPDVRAQDATTNAELIFGSYYLLECLTVLAGKMQPTEI